MINDPAIASDDPAAAKAAWSQGDQSRRSTYLKRISRHCETELVLEQGEKLSCSFESGLYMHVVFVLCSVHAISNAHTGWPK